MELKIIYSDIYYIKHQFLTHGFYTIIENN